MTKSPVSNPIFTDETAARNGLKPAGRTARSAHCGVVGEATPYDKKATILALVCASATPAASLSRSI
jgi:hypothetical protein